jgi:hypothetical protein
MAHEHELDELFQLPPGEFTAARNALAKKAGSGSAAIKALGKPPLAAWAVNQLYWKDRDRYETLVDAANEMRRTHKAVIEGRRGDLRAAGREHDLALDAALKATLALLETAGQPATDATRHAILNTLRALPSSEPPGRLTQTLAPGGFEMLAGISPGATPRRPSSARAAAGTATPPGAKGVQKAAEANAQREAAKARERRAEAERAVRDADQRARQAEFETARTARDATRAARRLEQARLALDEAQAEVEAAEAEVEKAERARETAERKARDAQSALTTARSRLAPADR